MFLLYFGVESVRISPLLAGSSDEQLTNSAAAIAVIEIKCFIDVMGKEV
jgi:hypothetical protein